MFSKTNEDEEPGLRRITKKILLDLCKRNSLYQTPYLNDVLYLHYQGFRDIEGLDEYTGLKSLWLECNAISEITGLTNQSALKCLFLQHNLISKIENLHTCRELDTLNLSHNQIANIENCGTNVLPVLTSLNLANNYIRSYEGLKGLLECKMLSSLDLSNNRIEDPLIVKIFSQMPELRVLILQGNPVVGSIPQYRKTFILECKNLTYLDSRPVFERDRACAEAWKRGGYEEEKAENDRWVEKNQRKLSEYVKSFIEFKELSKIKREEKMKQEKAKELTSDDESFKSITDTTSEISSDSEQNSHHNEKNLECEAIVDKNSNCQNNGEPENVKLGKNKANTQKVTLKKEIQIIKSMYAGRSKNKRRRRGCRRANRRKNRKIQNKGNWPRTYKLREEPEAVLATSYMYHEIVDLNFDSNQNLIFSEENLNRKSEVYKKAYNDFLNNVSLEQQCPENLQDAEENILEKHDQFETSEKLLQKGNNLSLFNNEMKQYQNFEPLQIVKKEIEHVVQTEKPNSQQDEFNKMNNEMAFEDENILNINATKETDFQDLQISNNINKNVYASQSNETLNKCVNSATEISIYNEEIKIVVKNKVENVIETKNFDIEGEVEMSDHINLIKPIAHDSLSPFINRTIHDNESENGTDNYNPETNKNIMGKICEGTVTGFMEFNADTYSFSVCHANSVIDNEPYEQNENEKAVCDENSQAQMKNTYEPISLEDEISNYESMNSNESINIDLASLFDENIIEPHINSEQVVEINKVTKNQRNSKDEEKEIVDNLGYELKTIEKTSIDIPDVKLDNVEVVAINSSKITKLDFNNCEMIENNNVKMDEKISENFHENCGMQVHDSMTNVEKFDENSEEEEIKNVANDEFADLFIEGTSCLQKPSNI